MQQYLDLAHHILAHGMRRENRTGIATMGVFGYQYRVDLTKGFPLLTTKRVFWKGVVHELLWFLRGDTNIDYLHKHNVHIWDEWADEHGNLGPIYGAQWRSWSHGSKEAIDQLGQVVNELRRDPTSRRLVVSSWNVGALSSMRLPPCHVLFQFYVDRGTLSCQLYQRSADMFLGVPFNVASYALLTTLIAHSVGLQPKEFIHTLGDVHIYENHIPQVRLQLERPLRSLPRLVFHTEPKAFDAYTEDDFSLVGYDPHPSIRGEVAV